MKSNTFVGSLYNLLMKSKMVVDSFYNVLMKPKTFVGNLYNILMKSNTLVGSLYNLLMKPKTFVGNLYNILMKSNTLVGSLYDILMKLKTFVGSLYNILMKPKMVVGNLYNLLMKLKTFVGSLYNILMKLKTFVGNLYNVLMKSKAFVGSLYNVLMKSKAFIGNLYNVLMKLNALVGNLYTGVMMLKKFFWIITIFFIRLPYQLHIQSTMKKILRLQITHLNKGDFFQFIKSVVQLSSNLPLLTVVREALVLDLALLEQAFAKERLTQETKEIQRLNLRRSKAFLFVFHQVKSFLHNEHEPTAKKAAEKVLVVVKELGWRKIAYFEYNKETAVLYNLVNALNERVSAELALLGLSNHIDHLKVCNDEFEAYYAVRNTRAAEHNEIVPFHRLYRGAAKHYTNFMLDVESIYRNDSSATSEVEQFIERLNVEVEKFRGMVG